MKISVDLEAQKIISGPPNLKDCLTSLGYKHLKSGSYARVYRKGRANKVLRVCDVSDNKSYKAWYNFAESNPSPYYVKTYGSFEAPKSDSKSGVLTEKSFAFLEYLKPISDSEAQSLFERLEKGSRDKDTFEYAYLKCKDACRNLPFKMDIIDFNMYGIVENVMKRQDGTFVITDPWK